MLFSVNIFSFLSKIEIIHSHFDGFERFYIKSKDFYKALQTTILDKKEKYKVFQIINCFVYQQFYYKDVLSKTQLK